MSYDPAKPRYTLSLAGKDYELEGSFALLEAVEHALKDNVISITMRCPQMAVSEMAKVIAALLTCCGTKTTPSAVGEILWNEVGVTTDEYAMLCLHVHAALRIFISRPQEREEATRRMGEMLGKLPAPPASPGETTSGSA